MTSQKRVICAEIQYTVDACSALRRGAVTTGCYARESGSKSKFEHRIYVLVCLLILYYGEIRISRPASEA
jgi:hypothetical protein